MRRTLVVATLLASVMLFFSQGARAEEGSLFREAVRSEGGVVASESPAAAEAGLEILNNGGKSTKPCGSRCGSWDRPRSSME